jgi:hypothetical protein
MHNKYERHLDRIEERLQAIEDALWEKPDRVDLEHLRNEVIPKLEEIHDDVRELKDEPEDAWGFGGESSGLT